MDNQPKKRHKGLLHVYVMAVGIGLLFGFTFLGSKVALEYLHPMQTLACRWTAALLFSLILAALKIIKLNFKGKPLLCVLGVGAVQPCAYAILEIWGIDRISTSEASILLAAAPIMVVILSIAFFHRPVNRFTIGAIVLSFTGVVVMIACSGNFVAGGKAAGYLFLFGAVLMGAIYVLGSERASDQFSSSEITFVMAAMGCIFFNGIAFAQGYGISGFVECFRHLPLLAAILFLGVVCSGMCYLVMNYVVSKIPAAQAATIQVNITVATGVISGVVLRGEPFGWYTVVGVVLIMTGIVASNRNVPEKIPERLPANEEEGDGQEETPKDLN